jgi:hypothetical protein
MFDRDESQKLELTPELAALEQQLAGLEISPLQLDRDRLMFEAGRAAGRRDREFAATGHRPRDGQVASVPRWFWPTTTAMLTAACVLLGAMLIWRDDAERVAQQGATPQADGVAPARVPALEDLREVKRLAATPANSLWATPPTAGYLEARFIALTRGVDAWSSRSANDDTAPPADAAQPTTVRDVLRELIPSRLSPADANS